MLGFNFTIFDFETTGLDPEKDRVIEMAAIRVVDGRIASEFSTFIYGNVELTPKITEITGITYEDINSGLIEADAFRILNRMIGDNILVAHNAAFDLAFLHHSFMRHAGRTFSNSFFDTLTISRDRHYYPHKLTDMCDKYGIVLEGAHRALNDVRACWELLKHQNEERDVSEWMNKIGYLKKFGPNKWYPENARVFETENKYEPRRT